jgi:hypothetical protein
MGMGSLVDSQLMISHYYSNSFEATGIQTVGSTKDIGCL